MPQVWSPKSVTMIKLIERVQRRATRIMLPGLEYPERLQQLDLLPLVHRRELNDLTTFYKIKKVFMTVILTLMWNFVLTLG